MIVLLTDPRLARVPIRDNGDALVDVRAVSPLHTAGPTYLRSGVVDRLVTAQTLLPRDVRLLVVDGYRSQELPCLRPACARESGPGAPADACTTPPGTAPHPTGGAVDLTLTTGDGPPRPPLPTCCVGPIPAPSGEVGRLLATALRSVGLVNYPARWWHWSYGDRFWASATRTRHARYGPVFRDP